MDNEGLHNQPLDHSKLDFGSEPKGEPAGGEPNSEPAGEPSAEPGNEPPAEPTNDGGEPGEPGAEPNGEPNDPPPANPAEPAGDGITDDQLLKILGERGISVSAVDEIKKTFSERESLKGQVEALSNKGIEFPNDQAKAMYEFAAKYGGFEMSSLASLLNASSIDLDKANAKTLQFEAFAMKYPQYSREDAKAIFDAKYEKDFGDDADLIQSDPLKRFEHDSATTEAKKFIQDAIKGFKEAAENVPQQQGPSEADLQAVKTGIDGALKEFKGGTINLPEYKTKEGQTVPASNLTLDLKPEEAEKFKEYLLDPTTYIREVIEKHKSENGVDWKGYANSMYQIIYPERAFADIHGQGVEKGMLLFLNKINNTGKDKTPGAGASEPVKKSMMEAFDAARAKTA